jgi:glycogen operon protein
MLLAGDEFGRTQRGNNNAYAQDNDTNWIDWNLPQRNASLVEFVRQLIELRKSRPWLRRDTFLKGTRRGAHAKDVTWLHPSGREMTATDWNESYLRSVAVLLNGEPARAAGDGDLLVIFNADESHVEMVLPAPPQGAAWHVLFDTHEVGAIARGPLAAGAVLRVEDRSTVLLESRSA